VELKNEQKMKAKFIYENTNDIFVPKSNDDIIKDISNLSEDKQKDFLFHAIKSGNEKLVNMLLNIGMNIETRHRYYKNGRTILMDAVIVNNVNIVNLIIDKGADIDAVDLEGWTALMHSTVHNSIGSLKILIDAGAKLDTKDLEGWTALIIAARNDNFYALKLLIESEANVNEKDDQGFSALDYAIHRKYTNIIDLLKKHGAK
jgi:uncharacterized protein